jgi:hypothetical protein
MEPLFYAKMKCGMDWFERKENGKDRSTNTSNKNAIG